MNSNNVKTEFMTWVKDNYGISVKSALEHELQKSPCNSRAKLFEKLCKILGTQDIDGIRQPVKLSDIHYNS